MPAAEISKRNTIVVFGAHPEDIEVGMAGTICRLVASGNEVYSVVATVPDRKEVRLKEAREAARILGIRDVIFLSLKASQLGYNQKTTSAIDGIMSGLDPSSIFTHGLEATDQDHLHVSQCVISAARKKDVNVYMYEQSIPGGRASGRFRAQLLIDISDYMDEKLSSIRAHDSQMDHHGPWWTEGIQGRAMYRGYQMRTQYAEAFEVVKIDRDAGLLSSAGATLPAARGKACAPAVEGVY